MEAWYSIKAEESIVTWKDWEAEIIFADNTVIRLNHDTTLAFTKLEKSSSEVSLEAWEMWARILKPLTDSSFFTVKTSDLSAWVRWTSVHFRKSWSWTNVSVIDSYNKEKDKEWILLTYIDPKTKKSIEENLKPEQSLEIDWTKKELKKREFKIDLAFNNSFILDNTKKDIIFMDELKRKEKKNKDLFEKINWELWVTLPNKDEVKSFFKEEVVRQNMEKIFSAWWRINANAIVQNVKSEVNIIDIKSKIEDLKNEMKDASGDKKKEFEIRIAQEQKWLDEKIQEIKQNLPVEEPKTPSPEPQPSQPTSNATPKPILEITNRPKWTPSLIKPAPTQTTTTPTPTTTTPAPAPTTTTTTPTKTTTVTPPPPLDTDKDWIPDAKDNCPLVPNKWQVDSNNNWKGDACDPIKPVVVPVDPISPE